MGVSCDKASRTLRKAVGADSVKPVMARAKLGGKRFAIYHVHQAMLPDNHGVCDIKAQEIYLCASDKGEAALDTLIHECLHAQMPWLDEEHVAQFGTELARVVTRMGYRRG